MTKPVVDPVVDIFIDPSDPTVPGPVEIPVIEVPPVPEQVKPVPMSDALADAVVSQLTSQMPSLSAEDVKAVLAAMNTVQVGDTVGVVRKSDDGVYAIRIALDGVHKWHLVNPADGSRWDDNENSIIMTWPTVP